MRDLQKEKEVPVFQLENPTPFGHRFHLGSDSVEALDKHYQTQIDCCFTG